MNILKETLEAINEDKTSERKVESYILIIYHHILKWCYIRSPQLIKWVHESILSPINKIKNSNVRNKSNLNKFNTDRLLSIYNKSKESAEKDNIDNNGNIQYSKDIEQDKYNIFQYIDTIDKLRYVFIKRGIII